MSYIIHYAEECNTSNPKNILIKLFFNFFSSVFGGCLVAFWGRFGGRLGGCLGGVWGRVGGVFVVFWEVFMGSSINTIIVFMQLFLICWAYFLK